MNEEKPSPLSGKFKLGCGVLIAGFLLWFAVFAAAAFVFKDEIISFLSKEKTSEPVAPTQTIQIEVKSNEPPPSNDVWGAGQKKVGVDIPAGEYLVVGEGYVEISPDSKGSTMNIIMNDNITNRRYVTVYDGEYLKTTKNIRIYPVVDAPKLDLSSEKIPEGQYKVGVDIPAGEYKVYNMSGGYFEVSKGARGMGDIVTNNLMGTQSSAYITVTDGQYLKLIKAYAELQK